MAKVCHLISVYDKIKIGDSMGEYTGRQIAIFTDVHGMLQPLVSILDDIKLRGITEIYSLGDNIGVGPNPRQVLDLMGERGVVSINGNSEEYSLLGIEPFSSYMHEKKIRSQEWTYSQLTPEQLRIMGKNPHSIDLTVGGKHIALCHFGNDVRIDFKGHSTWTYQRSMKYGSPDATKQFYYTNSPEQLSEIVPHIGTGLPSDRGFESAWSDPLFGGKQVGYYDEVIQGHVHFKYLSEDTKTKIRTIRAAGMGFGEGEPIDFASYIIIRERTDGYDVEEVLVPFKRDAMLREIDLSSMPDKEPINRFAGR